MGRGQIQDVLEFWNKALGKNGQKMIPGVRLTTNQARKTFATFGHRYTTKIQGGAVPLPVGGANGRDSSQRPQPVCRDPKFYSDRKYVCNATWDDLEEECHIARTMNLWSQGHHQPTVGSSMRDVLETIRSKHSTESF